LQQAVSRRNSSLGAPAFSVLWMIFRQVDSCELRTPNRGFLNLPLSLPR